MLLRELGMPTTHEKTLADLNLVTSSDTVYDYALLKQYALNNVFAVNNSNIFIEILQSKNIDYESHIKANFDFNDPKNDDSFEQSSLCNIEMIYIFLAHDVFDVLEPVWTQFRDRFHELFFHNNYDLGDALLPVDQQSEVVILQTIKYVKNGSLIDVYLRQGDSWVELKNLEFLSCEAINPLIKDHNFIRNMTINGADDFVKLIATIALSDIFNMPSVLFKRKETEYSFDRKEPDYFENILSLFIIRLTFSYDKYLKKPTLNKEFISPYHRTMRYRKIRWVISHLFEKEYCALFFNSRTFEHLNISDYNDFVEERADTLPSVRAWQNDHKNKLLYLLNLSLDSLDQSSMAFSNILYRNNPDCRSPFFDKRGYHGFLKHAKKSMIFQLSNTLDYDSESDGQHIFMVWSNWFGYTRHKKLNTHVVMTMLYLLSVTNAMEWDFNGKAFKEYLQQTVFMLDLLYEHLHEIWQKHKKIKPYKVETGSAITVELFDFFHHGNEENVLVNLNRINSKTTLKSLYRLCHEWHVEVRLGEYERNNEDYPHLKPFSQTVGKTLFTLIHNDFDLYNEGAEMHHCVNTFHKRVLTGKYLVFQVISGEERATLGVSNNQLQGDEITPPKYNPDVNNYSFHQCFGYCNKAVSEHVKKDAFELIKMLNEKKIIVEDRNKVKVLPAESNFDEEIDDFF